MFWNLSTVISSNIKYLSVNPPTREAIVEFNSGKHYSYSNVPAVAIDDVINADEKFSIGKWVNENCINAEGVICDNLDSVIRNIQREPIAA